MLIGITGKKRSGKDTIAEYLIKEHGFVDYKFASPIKNLCKDIFLWDDEWVNGAYKETVDSRWGISPREAQQVVGTELFREHLPKTLKGFADTIGAGVWCARFQYWYESLPNDVNVIVSDMRFLNEAEIIKNIGGTLWRVERDGLVSNDTHPSEMEMESIQVDFKILNNHTLEALDEATECAFQEAILHE